MILHGLNWDVESYKSCFINQQVLDLACHSGDSSVRIKNCGAKSVVGVDIREQLIANARSINQDTAIDFICNDITDYNFLSPLVNKSTVITCFGALYHLFDHFRFLSHVLKPNIDYCLIETLYGPESPNPEMYWGFEDTDSILNGWLDGVNVIPHGSPNISWIKQSANIFGFDVDFIARRYSQTDFSKVTDENSNKRMVVRLYNTKKFSYNTPLQLNDIWQWSDDNLVQGKIKD